MTRTNESGQWLAGDCDQLFFKGNPFVPLKDGIAAPDLPITAANKRRNVRDFVPFGLSVMNLAAEQPKCFEKKRGNVMRLESSCVGPLHLLPDGPHAGHIHRIAGQGSAL